MRWKLYCWAGLGLYGLLSVGDLALTRALLQLNRSAYESNPIAAACLDQYGWDGLALYKFGGVVAFAGAVFLLARRKPIVGAAVVTLGCAVLLTVTTYTHRLIVESRADVAGLEEVPVWPRSQTVEPSDDTRVPLPESCWFAGR